MNTPDSPHVHACRGAWLKHRKNCRKCDDAVFSKAWLGNQSYCDQGRVIFDKYKSSLSRLTATGAKK